MRTGPLAALAATLGLLATIAAGAWLARGPPLHPIGREPARPAAGAPARVWVCVTPAAYCSSPPQPTGEPCTCPDPWEGSVAGRVRTDRSPAPGTNPAWPSRQAPGSQDPSPAQRSAAP
ncbi:MAG: hypothetical protein KatS3mg117_1840 [Geminicoccaceae bacterium]|jgi:hypothetical protein|nr:MAG: hypothetical protein KatS3mg117_1840 [Geminicoccaceae bacterium]